MNEIMQVEMSLRLLKAGKHVLQGDFVFVNNYKLKSALFLHLSNWPLIFFSSTPMQTRWELGFAEISNVNPKKKKKLVG